MSVLIKGMEMPESGYKTLYIHSNGYVYEPTNDNQIWNTIGKATPVPTPHGRLIDADSLIAKHEKAAYSNSGASYNFHTSARAWVMEAPTIVETEEGKA